MDRQIRIYTGLAATAVTLLALLLYWPGLSGPFLLDDNLNIGRAWIENPDRDALLYSLTHNTSGLFGRGVAMASFILTGLQYGLDPWGYKFHNLLLHAATGLLLFRLLVLTLGLLEPALAPRRVLLVAGVTATLWLLHPLLVSTVLYAVQRMTQLAVLFTLLALLAYLAARTRPALDRLYILYGWVLFPLCMLLALLSKETGVLIPLYVIVWEVFAFRSNWQSLRQQGHQAVWLLVFVVLPLLAGAVGLLLLFDRIINYGGRPFTLGERLLTELHVVANYVQMILLPRLSGMGLYQDDFPVTRSFDLPTLLLAAAWLTVLALIWYARRRSPVLGLGLAVFVVSHLLESTFLPLELVFEHRNYLAAAGLLLPLVYYLLQSPALAATPLRWLPLLLLAFFPLLTWSRVQEWSSEEVLISIAVQEHPQSSRTRTEYANFLFTNGRIEEGLRQLEFAAVLDPADAGPLLHMLAIGCLQGRREAEQLERSRQLLGEGPYSVYAISSLDTLLARQMTGECKAVSLADTSTLVETALGRIDNSSSPVWHGYLLRLRALHALHTGRYVAGVVAFRMAHEQSGMASMLGELARYQVAFGQLGDAADTIALVRDINTARFGAETHLLKDLEALLASARNAPAQPVQD